MSYVGKEKRKKCIKIELAEKAARVICYEN